MQFEQTVNGQRLVAATPEVLETALALDPEAIKAGEGFPCVIDLRKKLEMAEFPAARCKAAGILYLHVPVTTASLSEQDIDACRREFARGWGRVLLVSSGGQRALFIVIMHAARLQGLAPGAVENRFPELSDSELKGYLGAYLTRHAVGAA